MLQHAAMQTFTLWYLHFIYICLERGILTWEPPHQNLMQEVHLGWTQAGEARIQIIEWNLLNTNKSYCCSRVKKARHPSRVSTFIVSCIIAYCEHYEHVHLHTPPACPILLGGTWSPGGLLATLASGHRLRPRLLTFLFGEVLCCGQVWAVNVFLFPKLVKADISSGLNKSWMFWGIVWILNNELFSGENSSRGEEDLWSGLLRLQPQQIRPAQWKVGTQCTIHTHSSVLWFSMPP